MILVMSMMMKCLTMTRMSLTMTMRRGDQLVSERQWAPLPFDVGDNVNDDDDNDDDDDDDDDGDDDEKGDWRSPRQWASHLLQYQSLLSAEEKAVKDHMMDVQELNCKNLYHKLNWTWIKNLLFSCRRIVAQKYTCLIGWCLTNYQLGVKTRTSLNWTFRWGRFHLCWCNFPFMLMQVSNYVDVIFH